MATEYMEYRLCRISLVKTPNKQKIKQNKKHIETTTKFIDRISIHKNYAIFSK